MARLIPVLLLGFVFYFVYVQGLECGIAEQIGEEDVQNILRKCMGKKEGLGEEKSDKSGKNSDSSDSSEETGSKSGTMSSTTPKSTLKMSRRDVGHGDSEIEHQEHHDHDDHDDHDGQHGNGTEISHKCVIQCIFNDLGMVDGNGFPDHSRVAQGILKNAKGRELRDFLQDSADECFQLMEQGEKLDMCDYSAHLVTCLAEKGRANCADWQIMNIPFHN